MYIKLSIFFLIFCGFILWCTKKSYLYFNTNHVPQIYVIIIYNYSLNIIKKNTGYIYTHLFIYFNISGMKKQNKLKMISWMLLKLKTLTWPKKYISVLRMSLKINCWVLLLKGKLQLSWFIFSNIHVFISQNQMIYWNCFFPLLGPVLKIKFKNAILLQIIEWNDALVIIRAKIYRLISLVLLKIDLQFIKTTNFFCVCNVCLNVSLNCVFKLMPPTFVLLPFYVIKISYWLFSL